MIRHAMFLVAATAAFAGPASAGPAEDATAAVTSWIDKFNAGDLNAFYAAHASDAVIIDEYSPYQWRGANAAQAWAADYDKDAKARGISGGRIDYAAPTRADSDGKSAYIILPTIYRLQQGGKAKSAAGHMTLVMTRVGNEWKIASWTYAGPAPK